MKGRHFNKMKYEAVIFDLDGTLINSLEDVADSVNLMLQGYGFPTHALEEFRYFLGNGPRKLIERSLPTKEAASASFVDEALAKYQSLYAEHFLEKTRAYRGVREMLTYLADYHLPLGICTNKNQEDAKNIVRFLFEPHTFQSVAGDREGSKRKPDPTKVLWMAQEFGVAPEKVAYLGDTGVDMQTAIHAGFLPVGVLWGFRDKKELMENGAKVLLEHPLELFNKVKFAKR